MLPEPGAIAYTRLARLVESVDTVGCGAERVYISPEHGGAVVQAQRGALYMNYTQVLRTEKRIRSTMQKACRTLQKAQERAERCGRDSDIQDIYRAAREEYAALLRDALALCAEKAEAETEMLQLLYQIQFDDEAERAVLLCRYCYGLQWNEIAQLFNMSDGHVKRFHARALQKLQLGAECS